MKNVSRRSFLKVMGASATVAGLGLVGCGGKQEEAPAAGGEAATAGDIKGKTVAFIPKVTGNAFFESANNGAQEKAPRWFWEAPSPRVARGPSSERRSRPLPSPSSSLVCRFASRWAPST